MWPGDVVLNTAEMQGTREEWAEGTATRLSGMPVLRMYRTGYEGEEEFGEDAEEHWLERHLPDNIRPEQCKLLDGEKELENVVGEVLAQISSDKKFREQKAVMPMITSLPPPWYRKNLATRPVPNPPVFHRTEGVHVWKGRKSPNGEEAAFELVISKSEDKLKLHCLHGKNPQPCIDCRNETRAFWENPDAVKKNAEDVLKCPVCPVDIGNQCTHMFYTPLYSSHRSTNHVYLRPINVHSRGNTRTPTIFYTMMTYTEGNFLCCHEKTPFKCKTCSIVRKAFLENKLIQPYLPKKPVEEENESIGGGKPAKSSKKSRDVVNEEDTNDDDDGWDSVGDGFGDEDVPPTGSIETSTHKRTRVGGDGQEAPPKKKRRRRGKKVLHKETNVYEDMSPVGHFVDIEPDRDYQDSDSGDSEFWDDAVEQGQQEADEDVSISCEEPVRYRSHDAPASNARKILSAKPGDDSDIHSEIDVREALFVALQIMKASSGTTIPQLMARDRAINSLMHTIKHLDRSDTGKMEWLKQVTRRPF